MQAVIFRYVTPRIRAKVGMWLVKRIQDTSERADCRLMPNIRGALECLSFSCDLNMPKARSGIPDQSDLRAFQDRKSGPSLRDPRELEV